MMVDETYRKYYKLEHLLLVINNFKFFLFFFNVIKNVIIITL